MLRESPINEVCQIGVDFCPNKVENRMHCGACEEFPPKCGKKIIKMACLNSAVLAYVLSAVFQIEKLYVAF